MSKPYIIPDGYIVAESNSGYVAMCDGWRGPVQEKNWRACMDARFHEAGVWPVPEPPEPYEYCALSYKDPDSHIVALSTRDPRVAASIKLHEYTFQGNPIPYIWLNNYVNIEVARFLVDLSDRLWGPRRHKQLKASFTPESASQESDYQKSLQEMIRAEVRAALKGDE